MTANKIQFTKEKETMLMTLSCRAIQSQWNNPIVRDPWAEEAMRHLDYDIRASYGGLRWWLVGTMGCTIVGTRAATFDQLTTRYLADHPNATVLHVGCGMDSRVFRVNPPASVDVVHPMILKRVGSNVGGTGATYRWSLDDPQDIKRLEPKLELIKEFRMHELVGFSRFALAIRAIFRAQEVSPALRRMNRPVVYRY